MEEPWLETADMVAEHDFTVVVQRPEQEEKVVKIGYRRIKF